MWEYFEKSVKACRGTVCEVKWEMSIMKAFLQSMSDPSAKKSGQQNSRRIESGINPKKKRKTKKVHMNSLYCLSYKKETRFL